MIELNSLMSDAGIKTIPTPPPITIVLPNGVTGNFQAVLDFFGITRNVFDILSIKQVYKLIDLTKESMLLDGIPSNSLNDYFNYLIEVKKEMEARHE